MSFRVAWLALGQSFKKTDNETLKDMARVKWVWTKQQ